MQTAASSILMSLTLSCWGRTAQEEAPEPVETDGTAEDDTSVLEGEEDAGEADEESDDVEGVAEEADASVEEEAEEEAEDEAEEEAEEDESRCGKKKPVKKKMRHTASTMKRLTLMKKRIHWKPTRTKKNLIVRSAGRAGGPDG